MNTGYIFTEILALSAKEEKLFHSKDFLDGIILAITKFKCSNSVKREENSNTTISMVDLQIHRAKLSSIHNHNNIDLLFMS